MALRPEHELHRRRAGRNTGLALVLAAFVALVFGLSVVKIRNGDLMQAFDHQPRATMLPREPAASPAPLPGQDAATPESLTPQANGATPAPQVTP